MTLAVHQPNFLPWIGYFAKMAASDVFVLLDTVQFPRGRTVANRAKFRGPNGFIETAAPVSIPKGREGKVSYRELQFANGKWRKKFLKSLEMGYGKEPYFQEFFPFLEELLQEKDFCEMNLRFIHHVRDALSLPTELFHLSDLEGIAEGKQERIFDLCDRFGASSYLSGKGAAKYNEAERFEQRGIELLYTDKPVFDESVLKEGVEEGLSILDPLFRIGAERCGEELRRDRRDTKG